MSYSRTALAKLQAEIDRLEKKEELYVQQLKKDQPRFAVPKAIAQAVRVKNIIAGTPLNNLLKELTLEAEMSGIENYKSQEIAEITKLLAAWDKYSIEQPNRVYRRALREEAMKQKDDGKAKLFDKTIQFKSHQVSIPESKAKI